MGDTVTLVQTDPNHPRAVLDIGVGDHDHADDYFQRAPSQPLASQPPPRPPLALQRPAPPPPSQHPPQPQQPHPEELGEFANPVKVTDDSPEEEDDMFAATDDHQQQHEYEDEDPSYQHQFQPPVVEPTPPFKTLEEERADLMYKLSRAARLTNLPVKQFAYNADIRELRTEVARVKAEQDVTASIAFQRQLLMTICSGLEFANRKFSYMDLNLDGWSESVLENIGSYDKIFEKLHAKHAGRISMPPEMELILMIGGSAVTWHLTHTMLGGGSRNARLPESPRKHTKHKSKKHKKKRRRREESEDEDDRQESVEERYARVNGYMPREAQPTRGRDMRGPGFDVGALMQGAGSGFGGLPMTGLPPMSAVPVDAFRAPQISRDIREVREQPRVVEEHNDGMPTPTEEGSERLSDIASEDLPMLPEDLDADDERHQQQEPQRQEDDTRLVEVPPPPARKGRGGRKSAQTKTVVVI